MRLLTSTFVRHNTGILRVILLRTRRPQGKIIFIRRTNGQGATNILGHDLSVDPNWVHRLIRAEVDVHQHHIQFFALRRRDPNDQPLLNQTDYKLPNKTLQRVT